MPRSARRPQPSPSPPTASPAAWAAALVGVVRREAAEPPRAAAARVACFGWSVTFQAMLALGEAAPVTPDALATLLVVRDYLAAPRRRGVRARVQAAARTSATSASAPTDLVAGAAASLAVAALATSADVAAAAVTDALERVVRATSRDLVARVVAQGMREAGALGAFPTEPRP